MINVASIFALLVDKKILSERDIAHLKDMDSLTNLLVKKGILTDVEVRVYQQRSARIMLEVLKAVRSHKGSLDEIVLSARKRLSHLDASELDALETTIRELKLDGL